MDQNLAIILNHTQSQVVKDVYLHEIDWNIQSLELKIEPEVDEHGDPIQIETELFFDEG